MLNKIFHYRSKEIVGGSSKPYYRVNDFGGRGGVFIRCQVKIEALAYKELFGFLSIPVELPYLRKFNLIIIGYRVRLLSLELPL